MTRRKPKISEVKEVIVTDPRGKRLETIIRDGLSYACMNPSDKKINPKETNLEVIRNIYTKTLKTEPPKDSSELQGYKIKDTAIGSVYDAKGNDIVLRLVYFGSIYLKESNEMVAVSIKGTTVVGNKKEKELEKDINETISDFRVRALRRWVNHSDLVNSMWKGKKAK